MLTQLHPQAIRENCMYQALICSSIMQAPMVASHDTPRSDSESKLWNSELLLLMTMNNVFVTSVKAPENQFIILAHA